MDYSPAPSDKFSFGLWTVGNLGRDPFGEPVRAPRSPVELVHLLGEVGAWGVNFHDNDLVPIDATPAERDRIVRDFQARPRRQRPGRADGHHQPLHDPVFKDGAFTANDPQVRAYAVQKTMRAMDLGVELRREDLRLLGRPRRRRERCHQAARSTRSSASARRSTSSANTCIDQGTATGSRSRPSPTSRAAISTWPTDRPRTWHSSRRWTIRRWSA